MKKIMYLFLAVSVGFLIVYLVSPLLGINITIGELFGRQLSFLKDEAPKHLTIAPGFTIKPYVNNLETPRFMYVTEQGDLLVTEPAKGHLLLIPYQKPQQQRVLISNLTKPHSMAVHDGYLYVAEENAIGRIPFNSKAGTTSGSYAHIIENIPAHSGHWTRTLKFGPDGLGYVSIGSSCNACIEKSPLRATISRFDPKDKHLKVYANGLRNSVGFDWSPVDGALYAVDNGRDLLGDHEPPEELNCISETGFYGWPYAYGDRIPDPTYGKNNQAIIAESIPPLATFPAHTAPLGLTFIKNPESSLYKQALVALHGSWNSSQKVGYRVISLNFNQGSITTKDFITGFLKDGKVRGRPVHLVEGKQGEMYLSDDFNGIIYLITPNS